MNSLESMNLKVFEPIFKTPTLKWNGYLY
jgi:hypothetical protein